MKLDLATARAIIAEASRIAAERAYKPITIVVLDAGGYLVAAERADGSPNKQYEIAHGKAHGAVSVGIGTRGLTAYARQDPTFFNGLALALGSPLLASPGGVLIRDADGEIVGAVGVSGESGDNDELLAVEAITSVSLVPKVD
jgi:uncharacterized protein GlcG (DUF336 family)